MKHSIEDYLHYIGATIPATKAGWRKMRCPFHEDEHASAAINFDENIFTCHGCGVKGDTYALIMHKEGLNYREAIKFASSVLTTGNTEIRQQDRFSNRISSKSQSLGRRGQHLSLGSGSRPTART